MSCKLKELANYSRLEELANYSISMSLQFLAIPWRHNLHKKHLNNDTFEREIGLLIRFKAPLILQTNYRSGRLFIIIVDLEIFDTFSTENLQKYLFMKKIN